MTTHFDGRRFSNNETETFTSNVHNGSETRLRNATSIVGRRVWRAERRQSRAI